MRYEDAMRSDALKYKGFRRSRWRIATCAFILCLWASCVWAAQTQPAGGMFRPGNGIAAGITISVKDFSRSLSSNGTLHPVLVWKNAGSGLSVGSAVLPESKQMQGDTYFLVVRIDPEKYRFSLHMASETGTSLSLAGWASQAGLAAAINASMYLPDNLTSTGYMRQGKHVNNARIGSKLGAFFVASPKTPGLPQADLLEAPALRESSLLDQYDIVIQNYRFMDAKGKLLWQPDREQHSIAAIGKDASGDIFFILCQQPLSPGRFAAYLQQFLPQIGTVMYVEGGAQAGLFIHFSEEAGTDSGIVFKGRQSLLYTMGNKAAPLPNILGVLPR